MKKMNSNNRTGLYMNAALLTLTLALLAATPTMAFGREKHGKSIGAALKASRPSGLKCSWWWWIRR